MNLVYKYLFSIELLHHYYGNGKCPDFEIVPSEDCRQFMRDCHLIYRFIGNKLFVGIEIAPGDVDEELPAIPMSEGRVFRFYLKLKNPYFLNFTNLPSNPGRNQFYYFSNLSGNKQSQNLFLSAVVNDFSNAASYLPADIVKSGTQLFECISPTKGKATSNDKLWKNIGTDRIVTSNDLITAASSSFRTSVIPPADTVTATVFGLNRTNNFYDRQVLDPVTMKFSLPQSEATVNLFSMTEGSQKSLNPGCYLVSVNNVPIDVYFDPQAISSGTFGVIDIFHHAGVPADFNLFDNGKVKEVAYQICFHNRSTIWKYIFKNDSTMKVAEKNAAISFSKEDEGVAFHSDVPMPLSQTTIDTLQLLDKSNTVVQSPVKNAPVNSLKKITINKIEFFCSEIFLNY